MSTFTCPYCSAILTRYNLNEIRISEGRLYLDVGYSVSNEPSKNFYLCVQEYLCPVCENHTVLVKGYGKEYQNIDTILLPTSSAKRYPDYIPIQIRKDYEEAYSIVKLSPKASATLSRRCLQGMIHDFWGIKGKNLNAEITALKDKVKPEEWKVMDSLRKLGNIGAHMEKDINLIVDIDSDEAEKLLKLIEHLIEKWYIDRHETQSLFDEIIQTADQKEQKRKQDS